MKEELEGTLEIWRRYYKENVETLREIKQQELPKLSLDILME